MAGGPFAASTSWEAHTDSSRCDSVSLQNPCQPQSDGVRRWGSGSWLGPEGEQDERESKVLLFPMWGPWEDSKWEPVGRLSSVTESVSLDPGRLGLWNLTSAASAASKPSNLWFLWEQHKRDKAPHHGTAIAPSSTKPLGNSLKRTASSTGELYLNFTTHFLFD